ncbi:DNA (cytosine-5)-methyltransferase 1 [Singulisphaera sp. GP187]|uniref:DNA cytosine methyltransferase n=1 Tax=Singulisphaera sp. GP187 TaxID=1882752 RepID=UPI00092771A0|nr:DNA (cytosine-5-)-methyltransferase [Singulisphaera sp. GP187]SIO60186.1 DNA (cytosine-5)-methyltransferase 1 [Singulisphaera sp. GP187]
MNKLRVLDLFSGIGGFSLGLERAGMKTIAFCEQDGYARRVIRKHWPKSWIYEDVRTLSSRRLKADGLGEIDVVCGGFPCQDISTAGKGKGLEGERSGLWYQMLRLIKEIRPSWVIAENVPALRARGADQVLADLDRAGYTATPIVVGAWAIGADHIRNRAWIVAYPHSCRRGFKLPLETAVEGNLADMQFAGNSIDWPALRTRRPRSLSSQGTPTPRVCRVDDGFPHLVDRDRCLGNAVHPRVVELIGRSILEIDRVANSNQ